MNINTNCGCKIQRAHAAHPGNVDAWLGSYLEQCMSMLSLSMSAMLNMFVHSSDTMGATSGIDMKADFTGIIIFSEIYTLFENVLF